ncbi:MAG TPA: hypothetical protein VLG47_01930 [Candidatus Saccharimonadales bacterium]|nr:hypothetical protein [Candidatus Saccharimonadales bacterium]
MRHSEENLAQREANPYAYETARGTLVQARYVEDVASVSAQMSESASASEERQVEVESGPYEWIVSGDGNRMAARNAVEIINGIIIPEDPDLAGFGSVYTFGIMDVNGAEIAASRVNIGCYSDRGLSQADLAIAQTTIAVRLNNFLTNVQSDLRLPAPGSGVYLPFPPRTPHE